MVQLDLVLRFNDFSQSGRIVGIGRSGSRAPLNLRLQLLPLVLLDDVGSRKQLLEAGLVQARFVVAAVVRIHCTTRSESKPPLRSRGIPILVQFQAHETSSRAVRSPEGLTIAPETGWKFAWRMLAISAYFVVT